MNCAMPSLFAQTFRFWMVPIILSICMTAGGQVPAATSTQTRAQAAAQARANAAQARQNATQARAAERAEKLQQRQQGTSNTARSTTQAGGGTATNARTSTSPASATPAATNGSSALPRTTQTPATRSSAGTSGGTTNGGTAGGGTLAWATRVYTPTGCTHNGNSAVCTFTFVNQGNEATLAAGGELSGIQLVDDAHVPHRGNAAHFMDKYGDQQPRLIVQPGDTGTYVVVFPNVNSKVASAEFHLREQIIGGINVGATGGNTGTSSLSSAK
jgi:hypothetical protein